MRNPLLDHLELVYKVALEIADKKNHDYAGDQDPMANFRLAQSLGVASTAEAVFIRILDKIARIARLLKTDPKVLDEGIHDTIRDTINYLAILDYELTLIEDMGKNWDVAGQ
jgi:hypothetical protein